MQFEDDIGEPLEIFLESFDRILFHVGFDDVPDLGFAAQSQKDSLGLHYLHFMDEGLKDL